MSKRNKCKFCFHH